MIQINVCTFDKKQEYFSEIQFYLKYKYRKFIVTPLKRKITMDYFFYSCLVEFYENYFGKIHFVGSIFT